MVERILPRDFEVPPQFIVPLSNAELQELGTFTAIWSQIDWMLIMAISFVSKIEMPTVLIITDTMTTGPRVGLLSKLCKKEPATSTMKMIGKLCDDNGGLIEDRNHIMHGLWAVHFDRDSGVLDAACHFHKGQRADISVSKLKTLSDRAAKLSNGLGKAISELAPLFATNSAPMTFYVGKGDPPTPLPSWPPIS